MSTPNPDLRRASWLARLLATGLYAGYAPIAPGTAGSAVGLAAYWVFGLDRLIPASVAITCCFFLGVAASAAMERELGEDPPVVVIDEVVGQWISLLLLPKSLLIAATSFVLFRLFDIIKPPPARNVEVLSNGWGIMLDDLLAAVYANISLRVLLLLVPGLFGQSPT
jgi:phosphatidylglycerophosphatase A